MLESNVFFVWCLYILVLTTPGILLYLNLIPNSLKSVINFPCIWKAYNLFLGYNSYSLSMRGKNYVVIV